MDRRAYFDELSQRWDSFTDAVKVQRALADLLKDYDIGPEECVIDLGCGTGNLSHVLCTVLGERGRIIAVDYATGMIEVARRRLADPRVQWLEADAAALPLEPDSVDRVVCCSAWPHFPEPLLVARELGRVLRRKGVVHVAHIDSREKINAIHTGVGGAISHDLLPPASELDGLLRQAGFDTFEAVDAADSYRVSARWPG